VGTIAVTTLVAWYTLLVVHTHDPSPCLPRFSLSHSVSVSRPSSRDSFCTYVRFLPVQTPCNARVHTRARIHAGPRAFSRTGALSLSLASLFFPSPLSRRVEGNSRSLLLLSFASLSRPRKHTPRQGDLLGETSSSTQPWTRFLYASLLQSPSLVVVCPLCRLPLLLSSF